VTTQSRSTIWTDAQGRTRQTITRGVNSLIGGATLATVMSSVGAVSNADWLRWFEGDENDQTPAPPGGTYLPVGDYAELQYLAPDGSILYLTIPAPLSTIFLADQETVDATAVASLTAQVTGCLVTSTNTMVTSFLGGVRRSKLKEYQ
jgi:hypothetical protein